MKQGFDEPNPALAASPERAWRNRIRIFFASDNRNVEIEVSAFDTGNAASNPKFKLSNRTGFARRLAV